MPSLQLTNKAAVYEEELARMIGQIADQIVSSARKRVYGNLKRRKNNSPLANSINSVVTPEGDIRVFTDKPYARFVEFGTINQPARPFLTPAVEPRKMRSVRYKRMKPATRSNSFLASCRLGVPMCDMPGILS